MSMNIHKRNVCGQSDTGAISRTISRIVLWWNGEHVERELYEALNEADSKREQLQVELDYLKGLMNEVHYTPWKLRKDGKARYRRVATKVLMNSWSTESEPIPDIDYSTIGEVPLRTWAPKKPIQLFQSSF